jgi:hypothetical protein
MADDRDQKLSSRRRQIGAIGTTARIVLGLLFFCGGLIGHRLFVVHGEIRTAFEPFPVALGLIAFPAAVLALQWLRTRITPTRLEATGPVSTTINIVVLVALVLTPLYAPPLSFTSNAALVFYGASMLLAAVRGYSGCEVLAVSNWILGRDDQVGCLVLSPIDNLERRLKSPPLHHE